MGLGQDHRFDIHHGKAGQDDSRDQHDQQEGTQYLAHNPQRMGGRGGLLAAPAAPGLRMIFIGS